MPVQPINDPTGGGGDAHRAGLLYGLARAMDWETSGRTVALLGANKIEQHGSQNHEIERATFVLRCAGCLRAGAERLVRDGPDAVAA